MSIKEKRTKITLVHHKTPKSVVLAWCRSDHPRLSDKRILETKTGLQVFLGKPVRDAKAKVLVDVVKKEGVWGFCKHLGPFEKEIHFWKSKDVNPIKLLETFSHEIAHAFGYHCETTAQKIGAVTAFSYTFLTQYFKPVFKKDISK
jgi:hypothetical protein